MKLHRNAKSCPNSRPLLCRRVEEQGLTLRAAAEAAGLSERAAARWLARYRGEGIAGLEDRCSAPHRVPGRTPEHRVEAIACLRRLRMTGAEIAECLGRALSTVSGVLTRIGLGKRSRLEPPEPPNRHERRRPGELLHVDVPSRRPCRYSLGRRSLRSAGSAKSRPKSGRRSTRKCSQGLPQMAAFVSA